MALAACASPLVGFLAEKVFGFKGAAAAGEGGGTGPDQGEDLTKAKALGNALLVCLVVPWTICLIVYTGQSCSAVTHQSIAQYSQIWHKRFIVAISSGPGNDVCFFSAFPRRHHADTCLCASGLHFTYPKDKQRAQDLKDKLVAAHDVEAHGGSSQQHQVGLHTSVFLVDALSLHVEGRGTHCLPNVAC